MLEIKQRTIEKINMQKGGKILLLCLERVFMQKVFGRKERKIKNPENVKDDIRSIAKEVALLAV